MASDANRFVTDWGLARTELDVVFTGVAPVAYSDFADAFSLAQAGRIFFSGQGRSGLAAQMAAMRFMHLGMQAHFVSEVTAPSIRSGDTLVLISGSGRTPVSIGFARIARDEGARVLLVTHQESSPLHELADTALVLPVAGSRQFGGTLFEQSAIILLDSIVHGLMRDLPDAVATMSYNHTNLQ